MVLLGDVGVGKSTIVEKLSGVTGRSSAASESVTTAPAIFESYDGSMLICDTPGTNSMRDQFKHNLHIAQAMNFLPVSCIMVVVKADERIDNVINNMSGYLSRFVPDDLPVNLLSVCVTHMDKVAWGEDDLLQHLHSQFEMKSAMFISPRTSQLELRNKLYSECSRKNPANLNINSDVFFTIFKLNDNNLKVLQESRLEVERFDRIKQEFYQQWHRYQERDKMDMVFEFQAWMLSEIHLAQERLSMNNNFEFIEGPFLPQEAGHLASMTNQLRIILCDIRIEAAKFYKLIDTNFRKCPHCGEVWTKVEGCKGSTTCGNRPTVPIDARKEMHRKMSTYTFRWISESNRLQINRNPYISKRKTDATTPIMPAHGCGKSIKWSAMAPVQAPKEFEESLCSTKDVSLFPSRLRQTWRNVYSRAIEILPKINFGTAHRIENHASSYAHCDTSSDEFDVSGLSTLYFTMINVDEKVEMVSHVPVLSIFQ